MHQLSRIDLEMFDWYTDTWPKWLQELGGVEIEARWIEDEHYRRIALTERFRVVRVQRHYHCDGKCYRMESYHVEQYRYDVVYGMRGYFLEPPSENVLRDFLAQVQISALTEVAEELTRSMAPNELRELVGSRFPVIADAWAGYDQAKIIERISELQDNIDLIERWVNSLNRLRGVPHRRRYIPVDSGQPERPRWEVQHTIRRVFEIECSGVVLRLPEGVASDPDVLEWESWNEDLADELRDLVSTPTGLTDLEGRPTRLPLPNPGPAPDAIADWFERATDWTHNARR